jgi:hypothetical protein
MKKVIATIASAILLGLLTAGTALADPPGNNGTVKIEGVDLDSIPDNNPHQGCIFTIEFRGFDEGDLNATYTLDAHPPSGWTNLVNGSTFIGEDPAGGANDLDAVVTIDLSTVDLTSLFEHPQQGFHIKLTVHAEGSIGADVKHKVFWVTGCPTYPITPPSSAAAIQPAVNTSLPDQPSSGVSPALIFVAIGGAGALLFAARRIASRHS